MRTDRWARTRRALVVMLASTGIAASAGAVTLTFDEMDVMLEHGSVLSTQYDGVTISANHFTRGFDYAVVFDSSRTGTSDRDLEAGSSLWSGGNLQGTALNNLLILQENSTGCSDLICDDPDDEGRRPAGELIFNFDTSVVSFGFDLVDVDDVTAEAGSISFSDGTTVVERSFASFLAGLAIGDNFANRITPFEAADLGLADFNQVTIQLGGSGAIDTLNYEVVPEPGTASLLGLGLLALAARRRA